eukprot:4680244-Lingulodinium_polyedra.AAC.1
MDDFVRNKCSRPGEIALPPRNVPVSLRWGVLTTPGTDGLIAPFALPHLPALPPALRANGWRP